MIGPIPLSRAEQAPLIRRILFLVKLLYRLDLLSEFVDTPEFKTEVDAPLEVLGKIRDPRGRVGRFSSFLKKLERANPRERHQMLRKPLFSQLIEGMKEASEWSATDNEHLSQVLLGLREQIQKRPPGTKNKLFLSAVGISLAGVVGAAAYLLKKPSC